jgi:hypothetical protein
MVHVSFWIAQLRAAGFLEINTKNRKKIKRQRKEEKNTNNNNNRSMEETDGC